jgi:hypothetical protein
MSLTGTDKSEEIFRSRLVSGHDHLTENAIVVKGLKKSYKILRYWMVLTLLLKEILF